MIIRYPQLDLYCKSKHLLELTDIFKDSKGNVRAEVDLKGFRRALAHVDSQTKSLPATAQVVCFSSHFLINKILFRNLAKKNFLNIQFIDIFNALSVILCGRLLLSKVLTFLDVSIAGIDANPIQRALSSLINLDVMNFVLFCMS